MSQRAKTNARSNEDLGAKTKEQEGLERERERWAATFLEREALNL